MSQQVTSQTMQLLVVEDDEIDFEAVCHCLKDEAHRFRITPAASLAVALDLMASESYDLVLLDLSLPDADGLELVDRIVEACEDTPIVVLSGLQDQAVATDAVRRGVQDYLLKEDLATGLLKRSLRYAVERHQLQRDLKAASHAKSEFLHNMSHEMRTPLTAIIGFAQVMKDDAKKLEPATQEEFLNTILRSGSHLLSLIDDMLDLAKIEANRIELANDKVDIRKLIGDVVAMMKARCQAKNQKLIVEISDTTPQGVYADERRLRQILLNLVNNAQKFSDAGHITLRVVANQSTLAHHFDLRFEVEDNGIGIEPEMLESIYEPFKQLDASLTRSREGAGLGLAICQRFAQLMRGRLEAESELGQGSRFSLEITAAAVQESAPRPSTCDSDTCSATGCLAGIRILVAEDNPETQRLVTYLLSKLGASTEICDNGQQALERLMDQSAGDKGHPPVDVVLMDMQMPVLDGYQATMALRESGYDGPVIALTAHTMQGDQAECLAAGCDDYLSKPFGPDALAAKISQWATAASNQTEISHAEQVRLV